MMEVIAGGAMGQRPYSIRTRIKTWRRRRWRRIVWRVRDHIPLEQGLRRRWLIKISIRLSSETIFH